MISALITLLIAAGHGHFNATPPPAPVFPIRTSSNGRYFVQADGATPFPMLNYEAWGAFQLSPSDQLKVMNQALAYNFTAIKVNANGRHQNFPAPPFDWLGNAPFLLQLNGSSWNGSLTYANINNNAPDFTTPNEAYWKSVDALLDQANQLGLLVLFYPAYSGFDCGNTSTDTTEGWMPEMVANGTTKMGTYATWAANRYRGRQNIFWMMSGDCGTANAGVGYHSMTAPQKAVLEAIATNSTGAVSLTSKETSSEWGQGSAGYDINAVSTTLWTALTTDPSYDWTDIYATSLRSYTGSGFAKPAFEEETRYEGNVNGSSPWRQYDWEGWLGTIGGYCFGNEAVWPFNTGWQTALVSTTTQAIAVMNGFIKSIAWYNLVPSGLAGNKTLCTAGCGTTQENYVAASSTPDGTLMVAYVAPSHSGTFTTDSTAMSGSFTARWFDPSASNTGYTAISSGNANTGTKTWTLPSAHADGFDDWVLVLTVP